jgi:hypothetical protein
MTPLTIRFHPDRDVLIFPDIEEGQGVEANLTEVVCVANGTHDVTGTATRPSVLFKLELPDGKIGVALTTARLLCTFAKMIEARHPNLFEGP